MIEFADPPHRGHYCNEFQACSCAEKVRKPMAFKSKELLDWERYWRDNTDTPICLRCNETMSELLFLSLPEGLSNIIENDFFVCDDCRFYFRELYT